MASTINMNRIHFTITIISILIALTTVSSCRIYSWFVLENPEFPDRMLPTELEPDILDKYTVGNVIVQPRVIYNDGAMKTQKVFILFFSKEIKSKVSIKTFSLSCDGVEMQKSKNTDSYTISDWEYYKGNAPFYVCFISSDSFETLKDAAHLFLIVTVTENSGNIIEKKIDTDFELRKRAYLE